MSTIIEKTQSILMENLQRASDGNLEKDVASNVVKLSAEIIKVGNLQVKYMATAGTLGNRNTVFGDPIANTQKLL